MSPKKRKHEQAFSIDDSEAQPTHSEADSPTDDKHKTEKEQEVWDAIREAHYEAIEQLPLTLQRQLSLMRQLDEQTISCTTSLIPSLKKYIHQRRAMAGIFESPSKDDAIPNPSVVVPSTPPKEASCEEDARASLRAPEAISRGSDSPDSRKPPETTRELLSHVAWMSDELLRASQEKVNLAQANHDMVERHIRLLDQAIKEQEAAFSADSSNSSNGLVVQLPELVIPKYSRKSRNDGRASLELDILSNSGDISLSAVSIFADPSQKEETPNEQQKDPASLTIILPAKQPNEELYCYCNRVSFGEMIACDGESCEREWFHLGCVGLTEVPDGEWYCEDCRIDDL